MASTSSSSIYKGFKYDVFLSFRGEDTRKTFVDHLYYALQQKSIHTYKDDERITKGKRISDETIKSIEDSKFYIIVFSKNYASSSWCLDELVKIMECHKITDQTAYPVFYDVEPSEVRKQIGAVGEAFAKRENEEASGKWREALKEASDLAGWELKNTANGHEAKCIQKIVEEISLELRSICSSTNGKLVGMETRVEDVISSLENSFDDVRVIGIKGMGGCGKTTLARAVFDQISSRFKGQSFVENVREVSKASLCGLKSLQKQVLSDVLHDQGIMVNNVYDGKNMMKRMMLRKKVLVVLDDVDHIDQLEALAGEPNWFKPGSRIIITTRDEQVLIAHRVNFILDVNLLSDEEAICLFSRYAFGRDIPIPGYENLSIQVVRYAAGLPLTIKVLGSFLCGKNELEWIDAIERLKTIPLKETLEKLELSYNGLEDDYKEIFLDVACLLKGAKEFAIRVLESRGFHARNGLRVLEQKSLISTSSFWGIEFLKMHDHIEEMGKNIVRRLHPHEPRRHSRLWIDAEVEDIFVNDQGTEATRCIEMRKSVYDPKTVMRGLQKMKELEFLFIDSYSDDRKWKFDTSGQYLPNSLRYLHWAGYLLECLPKTFLANNLVGLVMRSSNIARLWERGERKVLNKLRFVSISSSNLRTFDGELIPNLELLSLSECHNLVDIHNPKGFPKLKFLDLADSKLRNLNLGPTPDLETLDLQGCCDLVELHIPFRCPKLKVINLSSHSKTSDLGLSSDHRSGAIYTIGTDLVIPYMPGECLKFKAISLTRSKLNTLDLGLISDLESLSLEGCDLIELHMPDECPKLKYLSLANSKLRNITLGLCPDLEMFNLAGCCDLVELHMPFGHPKLKSFNINNTKLLTLDLGLTPNLVRLDLKECFNLVEIRAPVGCLDKLVHLDLSGCGRFESFLLDRRLQSVEVASLSGLCITTESIDICPLHLDNNSSKSRVTCIYKELPFLVSGNLEKLMSVNLCACNLESCTSSVYSLQFLKKLTLEGNIPETPKDLDRLHCLKELIFSNKEIKSLPDSLCMLKQLKSLHLKSCWLLDKLPEDLGLLECLEELIITDCIFLRWIPNSICKMKSLEYLHLPFCILVEKLPEELGWLESLKELNIEGTGVNHLPLSIFSLKGLRIVGSKWRLQSYGLTSVTQTSEYGYFCYI